MVGTYGEVLGLSGGRPGGVIMAMQLLVFFFFFSHI